MSSKLQQCPTCQEKISVLADPCPKCGHPEPFVPVYEIVESTCDYCEGKGTTSPDYYQSRANQYVTSVTCRVCDGTGRANKSVVSHYIQNI